MEKIKRDKIIRKTPIPISHRILNEDGEFIDISDELKEAIAKARIELVSHTERMIASLFTGR